MKNTLPITYLQELFDADFEAGTLTWRVRPVSQFKGGKQRSAAHACANWNSRWAGRAAGTQDGQGYLAVHAKGKLHRVHRIIFALAHGFWPDQIDHKNGIRDDNRLANLANVSIALNNKNQTARRGGSSRFPGVSLLKRGGRWQAGIKIGGKRKHLGYFTNEEDAAAAYRTAARAFGFTERHLQPAGDAP